MTNYIKHLQTKNSTVTLKRKIDYIDYNAGLLIKRLSVKTATVLEVGPGMGECIYYLNKLGFKDIDIVDNDKKILNRIMKINHVRNFYNNDLLKIEKHLGQYDLIIMIQVLEHLPVSSLTHTVNSLYSHLKQGGILVIVVPNANNPLGLIERYGDLQHQTSFTSKSLEDLIDGSGIRHYEKIIRPFNIPPYTIINIIRIIFQKLLHYLLLLLLVVNGGVFFPIMTPNIILEIKKKK